MSRRSWVEQIMGLPISVLARGKGAESKQADAAVRKVFAELVEVDRVFSPYKADSALSLLARGEDGWDRVDPVVREVAERCVAAQELTRGLFDAQVPGSTWDPSGLVKGWAVERAGERLREVVDVDWCLNAGGDVLVVSPSKEPFRVGLQDPRDSGLLLVLVPITTSAGEWLEHQLTPNPLIHRHTELGDTAIYAAIAVAVLAVVLWWRQRESTGRTPVKRTFLAPASSLLTASLTVVAVVVSAVAVYDVVRIGDSGAKASWSNWAAHR
ncbi:FAD:protein FMN transferase [Kribbella capetownensis]|uniref:FAD:protein FMN transferase n=1 Tax=Kribbella capetownensis TaxID=1572659 RepID=A0A4R0JVD9_9ACTN|nr:FAD:protein FMN transferase [Kribbella capetownensis]TCC50660.1 FAD:protein FMN transferase [Kribbella capetownensis]